MTTRRRPIDEAVARSRRLTARSGANVRAARIDRNLGLADVGQAVGLSIAQVSRIERGLVPHVSIATMALLHAAVGLELSIKSYPGGPPVRDTAHLRLISDFCSVLHPTLGWSTEVPMPQPGDLRAWDLVIRGDPWRTGVEAETGPRDAQSLVRRIVLKQRDSGVDQVILLLRPTAQTKRFLDEASEHIQSVFPGNGRDALGRLMTGLRPDESSVILLPQTRRT
jgi:transcriptional regulator with XRE-family HTH domain